MLTPLILSGVLAAVAQLPSPSTSPAPSRAERLDPAFSQLFKPGDATPIEPSRGTVAPTTAPAPGKTVIINPPVRARPRTKVVCGMTLILVGPEGDRDMPKPAPRDGVTYTMRRYPPPACGNEQKK